MYITAKGQMSSLFYLNICKIYISKQLFEDFSTLEHPMDQSFIQQLLLTNRITNSLPAPYTCMKRLRRLFLWIHQSLLTMCLCSWTKQFSSLGDFFLTFHCISCFTFWWLNHHFPSYCSAPGWHACENDFMTKLVKIFITFFRTQSLKPNS